MLTTQKGLRKNEGKISNLKTSVNNKHFFSHLKLNWKIFDFFSYPRWQSLIDNLNTFSIIDYQYVSFYSV